MPEQLHEKLSIQIWPQHSTSRCTGAPKTIYDLAAILTFIARVNPNFNFTAAQIVVRRIIQAPATIVHLSNRRLVPFYQSLKLGNSFFRICHYLAITLESFHT